MFPRATRRPSSRGTLSEKQRDAALDLSHAVELIRFALYGELNALSAAVVAGCVLAFMAAAVVGYDPGRGMMARRAAAE